MTESVESIKKAADYISNKIQTNDVDVGIILGTGLKGFSKALQGVDINYSEIPNFPQAYDNNSDCKITFTNIADKKTICFLKRLHYYEGYPIDEVVFPVRVMKELGVKILIILNSSGTLTKSLKPGDIMLIRDHINLMGVNPLVGKNINVNNSKFVNMSEPYSKRLISLVKQSTPVSLKEGVYVGVSGPTFETPAEARYLRKIGGTAVGMSTVPETIVANYYNIETLALSCISNYASSIRANRLHRDEAIEIAKKTENDLISIILNFFAMI